MHDLMNLSNPIYVHIFIIFIYVYIYIYLLILLCIYLLVLNNMFWCYSVFWGRVFWHAPEHQCTAQTFCPGALTHSIPAPECCSFLQITCIFLHYCSSKPQMARTVPLKHHATVSAPQRLRPRSCHDDAADP